MNLLFAIKYVSSFIVIFFLQRGEGYTLKKKKKDTLHECFLKNKVFFFKKINLFIFGCVGSSLPRVGFSLVAASGGHSLLWCAGFSLRWLLLLRSTGSRRAGFSSRSMRAQ